jgi:hypothetical protein
VQSPQKADSFRKILFVPVSGPAGIGEYQRSLFLAQSLLARHPRWDVRLVVSVTAPFVDNVPVPIFRTTRSPTKVPTEVDHILEEFRPSVVIFDCAGRRSNLCLATQLGARTVFVSNHRRKRRRGFGIRRLCYTDDHWILQPNLNCGGLTVIERLKLHWLGKREPVFLGPVFPETMCARHVPERPFFLCCPGGGGNQVQGLQSGAVFAEAARDVAEALDIRGVVITGANFTGELPASRRLQVHRSLPGSALAGLLSAAKFALVGGGDLLSQAIANKAPSISAPSAPDQLQRISAFEQRGLCMSARPDGLAEVAVAAHSDGRLASLIERLRSSDMNNGLSVGVERIEMLAANRCAALTLTLT